MPAEAGDSDLNSYLVVINKPVSLTRINIFPIIKRLDTEGKIKESGVP